MKDRNDFLNALGLIFQRKLYHIVAPSLYCSPYQLHPNPQLTLFCKFVPQWSERNFHSRYDFMQHHIDRPNHLPGQRKLNSRNNGRLLQWQLQLAKRAIHPVNHRKLGSHRIQSRPPAIDYKQTCPSKVAECCQHMVPQGATRPSLEEDKDFVREKK